MVIRLLNKIINGDGEFPSGSIVEIDEVEAARLIEIKSAVPMEDFDDDAETDEDDFDSGYEAEPVISLSKIPGLKDDVIEELNNEGIYSVQELVENSIDDLIAIKGIGAKTAERILKSANELLG